MTLLNVESSGEKNEFNQTIQELYFYYGNAEYYMGEEEFNGARDAQPLDYVSYRYTKPDGAVGHSSYNANVAWEKYKIRLISWECEPAIVNTYK